MGTPTCSIALQNVSVVDLTAFELPEGREEIGPAPDGSYTVPLSGGRTIFLAPNQKNGTFDFKCDPLPCRFSDLRFIRHAIGLPKSVFLADIDYDREDDVVVCGEKQALVIQGNGDARPAGVVCNPAVDGTQDRALASIAKKCEAEGEDRFLAAEHIQASGIHDDALLSVIADPKIDIQNRLSYMSNIQGKKAYDDAYASVVNNPVIRSAFQSEWPKLFGSGRRPEKRNTNLPTCLIARGNGSLMRRSEFVMPQGRKELEVNPQYAGYSSYRIYKGNDTACLPADKDCKEVKNPLLPTHGVLAPLRVLRLFLGCPVWAYWADVDGNRDPDLIVTGRKYVAVIQHSEGARPDNVICNPATRQDQDQMLASIVKKRESTIGDRWLMLDNMSEGKGRDDLILSELAKNKDMVAEECQIMLRYLSKGQERDASAVSLIEACEHRIKGEGKERQERELREQLEGREKRCKALAVDPERLEKIRAHEAVMKDLKNRIEESEDYEASHDVSTSGTDELKDLLRKEEAKAVECNYDEMGR